MLNDWNLDLGLFGRAMLAQKRFIALGTALFTLLGVVFLATMDDKYTGSVMLLVEDRNLNVPQAEDILETGPADPESVLSHVELIRGPEILRRAMSDLESKGMQLFDEELDDSGPGLLASVAAAIPSPPWTDQEHIDGINGVPAELTEQMTPELIAFDSALDVAAVGRSKLIKISFDHKDPSIAAAGANALADAYVETRREENQAIGDEAVQWMMEQASKLRAKASAADQAVESYRIDSGLLQGGGSRLIEQKITDTHTQLTAAELDSLALNTKVQAIEQALRKNNPFALPEIADAPSVTELRTQITTFEAEIADLRSDYGPNHPLYVAKAEQIALTKKSLDDEVQNIVNGFRNQANAAERRVEALRGVLKTQEQQLADANLRGVELRDLEKEAKIGNDVLEGFLGRLQQAVTREDLQVQPLDLRVANRAETPVDPSGPPRALLSIVCLIGGFLVSSSAAMVRELSRRLVREPDDLKGMSTSGRVWVVPRRDGDPSKTAELHQLVTSAPYAHFSASIRNIYRQTVATLPGDQHVIMFTSSQPGDGKTTMSLCFAEVIANTGKSVVLVDTDFRRPKIHVHTGLGRIAGLSDWLEGTEPLRCRRPQGSEFYAITAGSSELRTPDRWNNETIAELLATLTGRFDCVIMDTPPLAALSDPYLIAGESSMVLFVTRWKHTKLAYVRDLVPPLKQRTERVEVILTDLDIKAAAAHGYTTPMEYYKDTAQYYTE